jgi:hypothetical protein
LLWRLDTLLLNLGLTLLLSAFFFNPSPIYRHRDLPHTHAPSYMENTAGTHGILHGSQGGHASAPNREMSRYLWLAWGLVVLLHVAVSLVWKVVGRLGIGAVTWGVSQVLFLLKVCIWGFGIDCVPAGSLEVDLVAALRFALGVHVCQY